MYNGSAWVNVAAPVQTVDIADLAVTTAKIANANVTTGKIADGAVTAVKLADGGISVTAGGGVNNTDVALTGSYVDHATAAFSLPSGWATATIYAWGTAGFGTASGVVGDARIEIGASNGTAVTGFLANNTDSIAARHQTSVSGTVTIAIAVRNSGGTGDVKWSVVNYMAVRIS